MASIVWDRELAEVYDRTYRAKFEPAVLDPMVGMFAGLAGAARCSSSPSVPGE